MPNKLLVDIYIHIYYFIIALLKKLIWLNIININNKLLKMELVGQHKVSSSKFCCVVCNKQYTKKSSLDKHRILCDFKIKTKRENQIELEELGDIPTHFQLVKIVQELVLELEKTKEKLAEMEKWVSKKKRKINIISWLNTNIIPTVGFLEWVHTELIVKPEHFENLMENNLYNTIQQIFESNLSEKGDFVYPISCFNQKSGVFYICEKKEDGSPEWRKLVFEDFVLLLKIVKNNMIKQVTKWKAENQHHFDENDKIAILFNKALIKLMNISFSQDNNFSKIKNGLYNYLKIDLKTIEFDFEFE
jgi:hypothetical protein